MQKIIYKYIYMNYKKLVLENPYILNFQNTESNIQIPHWFIPREKKIMGW